MDEENFQKVFTRKLNTADVATAKAEDKLLEDEQYIPPPGNISVLKCKNIDGAAGQGSMLSLGGVRMQESRTWKSASILFSRSFSWSSEDFVLGDLQRLNSFQVTTSKKRTSTGSVTAPLFGASVVDLEPTDSNDFHLLIAFGQDVEKFCSNNYLFEMKGSLRGNSIVADVTKWLPEKFNYREFEKPSSWSDGSEFVQKGEVPFVRSGAQLGILKHPNDQQEQASFTMICTGGICMPSPGPLRILPADSNIFLLQYPGMTWTKLPRQNLLDRSHHSMYITGSTVFIIGGYSWAENKPQKLFPVTEITRIVFNDCQVEQIDMIKLDIAPTSLAFPHFLTGFCCTGHDQSLWLFGGIPFPHYDPDKENLHTFLPPETPRNRLPDPSSLLLKINLVNFSISMKRGPGDARAQNGAILVCNASEPLLIMTCDPHIFIYRPK